MGIGGKAAIVCGASSGIGRAVALELAREGARLVVCARCESRLREAAKKISEQSGSKDILAVQADVSKKSDIDSVVSKALDEFGGVDILFTNAAGPRPGKFLDTTDEDWQNTFDMTLMSVVRLCRACLPIMRQRNGGSIVNLVSVSVKQPIDNLVLSNSLRMAVVGLAKTLANEVAQYNVRVNNVCPGYTRTPRVEGLADDLVTKKVAATREEAISRFLAEVPMKRIAEPEEVAAMVAFLCSERARYVTGSTVFVDGGALKSAI